LNFLEEIQSRILVADGAMGTLLYLHGIDRCFDELNISEPNKIKTIHEAYIKAGADVIQTNTFGANSLKLARYGMEDDIKRINEAAVHIARQAATDKNFVFGTIGGIRAFKKSAHSLEDLKRNFREQLFLLLNANVDGILLETYYDLEEITNVIKIARKESDKPIIANMSLHETGVLEDGTPLKKALQHLADLGANVVGINCRLGPHYMIQSLEKVPLLNNAYLSAYPNGSFPGLEEGQITYETDESYFSKCALEFRKQGVRLIGGCCGTTPKHIEAISKAVSHLTPITEKQIEEEREVISVSDSKGRKYEPLQKIVKEKRSVIVELDPPKKLGLKKFLEGAESLKTAGIDALTLADNSLATPRICNMACGSFVKDKLDLRCLMHISCRDRNLIGLQSHLMGLHTLGFTDLLAVTGDPSKIGDFPGATSVYDLSSFDLISLIKQFNQGISYSGKSLGEKTDFSIAAAFNPHVKHLDKAVKRLEKKMTCGADYFLSQPIYSEELIQKVYEETKHLAAPIYIGIMPLTSSRNAEFIHNEVPGIRIPDPIREAMSKAGENKDQARKEGLAIARSLIDAAYDLFNGIYLVTPFLHYESTVDLAAYIQQKGRNMTDD
jgi:methionine synthase I (cobalamin-dependent)/5,10-methylenetetrahydrofolate reductase